MKLTLKYSHSPSLTARILRLVLAIAFATDQLPIFPFFEHPTQIKKVHIAAAQAATSAPVNNVSPATTINFDPNPSTVIHAPTLTQKGPSVAKTQKNISEGRVIVRFKNASRDARSGLIA